MHLSERVATYIEEKALLEPGQSLLVGVSGGPDSLCLLDCLNLLRFRPVVAHFDHRMRPGSDSDGDYVRKVANSYGLPFELGRAAESAGAHVSEETARFERYRFLTKLARQRGIERIAVGHTANDQAETVLMHLIRGAGSSGLSGMRPATDLGTWTEIPESKEISLIRPLLEVPRQETEAYCIEHGLSVLVDPTNQDSRYFRNRLRNDLMPELQTYNPRVQEVLLRTANVLSAEADAIEQLVEERWRDLVTEAGDGVLALQIGAIIQAPLAVQRAAMRRAILELAPELRDVGFKTVERALSSVRTGKRLSLQGGLDMTILNGEAYLRKPNSTIPISGLPQLNSDETQSLNLPFQIDLSNGWRIVGEELEREGEVPDSADTVWFDAAEIKDEIKNEITIRIPRRGDRMAPIGMSGSVKLSDLMVNRKIPQLARARWPVIAFGKQIAWVPSLHRAKLARVVPETSRVLHMRLLRPANQAS